MTQEEEKQESIDKKSQITPAEAEKRVSTAVAEVVPPEGDGLLIEEDGDPFWVIQRVFWGILKTGALLAILLFLIWLVWRPTSFLEGQTEPDFEFVPDPIEQVEEPKDDNSSSWWKRLFDGGKEEAVPTVNPKTVPVVITVEPEKTENNNTENSSDKNSVEIAYELEAARVLLVRGLIPESVQWLREAKTIGDISMQMLRDGTPQRRSARVEEIIAASDELFIQSVNLRTQLQTEIAYFLSEGQAANDQTVLLEQQITATLQQLDPVSIEGLVAQKIKSQQNASYFMSNAKIRDTLLRNIQSFDQLLRQRSIPLLNPATVIRAN